MHDYSYSAHLVINDGYEDRLDMKISCQNAQQLLRARDSFSDQMNTYIAEFAMQSNLVRMPSDEEQNTAALQAIIQEQTEKAKQQAPTEDITGGIGPAGGRAPQLFGHHGCRSGRCRTPAPRSE